MAEDVVHDELVLPGVRHGYACPAGRPDDHDAAATERTWALVLRSLVPVG